jgi:hypothetical protein
MKTAVEWLIDELRNKHGLSIDLYSEFEQAKEMEKEQIVEGFNFGVYDGGALIKKYKMSGEQYYNETFKQQEQ